MLSAGDQRIPLVTGAQPRHTLAETPTLWLGDRNREFGYQALYRALQGRAEQAGSPEEFTPHRLRHTGAGRWLDADGSEDGLVAEVRRIDDVAELREFAGTVASPIAHPFIREALRDLASRLGVKRPLLQLLPPEGIELEDRASRES